MASDIDTNDTIETLGQFLLRTRIEHEIDLKEMANETKISLANLQAIESDNYSTLPSLTFSRGLYTIYAKHLGLDTEEILRRFTEERSKAQNDNSPKPTPSILAKEIGSMAERPPAPPTSLFGLIFIVFLILIAVGCWYYSINPATYISQKLRGLETSTQTETVLPGEPDLSINTAPQTVDDVAATAPVIETVQAEQQRPAKEVAGSPRYSLQAFFHEKAEIEVSVDNSISQKLTLEPGKKTTWTAEESIELILPPNTTTELTLNGRTISLPTAENGKVTITVPEILFE